MLTDRKIKSKNIFLASDHAGFKLKEEIKKFLEGLPQSAFKKIKTFFETMPQLRHEIEVENPKTKVKSKITLKGIKDFFQ